MPKRCSAQREEPRLRGRGKGCRRQSIQRLLRGGSMPFRGLRKPPALPEGLTLLFGQCGAHRTARRSFRHTAEKGARLAQEAGAFPRLAGSACQRGGGAETKNRPGGPRAAASAGFCHGHAAVFAPGRAHGGFAVTRPARRGTGCIRPEWVCRNPRCPPSRRWLRPAPAPAFGCL